MPIEIERKFLVRGTSWLNGAKGQVHLRQAYLTSNEKVSVRVRVIESKLATLTVKMPEGGVSRFEFEQDIPLQEGLVLMRTADNSGVEKVRIGDCPLL